MRATILRRLVLAAGALTLLLFLPARVDAALVPYENGTEIMYRNGQRFPSTLNGSGTQTVYRNGQRFPSTQNTRVRRLHHHHRRAGSQTGSNSAVITDISYDGAVSVPDGGSTLAMFGSVALLLLGYHRLGCKRIAA